MQCPPTSPGVNLIKFHLVPAASKTALVSISNNRKILESSFTKAILISRCEFSITFAASATLIDGAICVPAVIMERYRSSTTLAISGVEPEVTFNILVIVCVLSPGLIRSGE